MFVILFNDPRFRVFGTFRGLFVAFDLFDCALFDFPGARLENNDDTALAILLVNPLFVFAGSEDLYAALYVSFGAMYGVEVAGIA